MHPLIGLSKTEQARAEGTASVMLGTPVPTTTWALNMIEVDWRDIKKQCPATASLCTYLGVLWEFIKQLGMEHQSFLESLGDTDNFPESPSKEITQ
jgi:hypothetical protein